MPTRIILSSCSINSLCIERLSPYIRVWLIEEDRESIVIPTNPCTSHSVGYAFVDVNTPQAADSAISQLSGKEILARKISVQLARKSGIAIPNIAADDAEVKTIDDEADEADGGIKEEQLDNEDLDQPQTMKSDIAPALNWNAINGIKIRTSLGSGSNKRKTTNELKLQTGQRSEAAENMSKLAIDPENFFPCKNGPC